MDYITLMVVGDQRSPVRRIQIRRDHLKRAAAGAVVLGLLVLLAIWDYWRVRADNSELAELRVKTVEQQDQIEDVEQTLGVARAHLDRMLDFERKVRIIANLPGSTAIGGAEISEVAPSVGGGDFGARPVGGQEHDDQLMPPAGVPVELALPEGAQPTGRPLSQSKLQVEPLELEDTDDAHRDGLTTVGARYVAALGDAAEVLGEGARSRAESLTLLLDELDVKRTRLASMPSVWPSKGWLTSRYGYRISPFTGRRQLHGGIDIAAAPGTAINAPARGKVVYSGMKGPLGKTLTIDHGFGVRTFYGHTQELYVKKGETVERGQKIASVGSTGRSTGPHLHYTIEVHGKTRDPLDYILD